MSKVVDYNECGNTGGFGLHLRNQSLEGGGEVDLLGLCRCINIWGQNKWNME